MMCGLAISPPSFSKYVQTAKSLTKKKLAGDLGLEPLLEHLAMPMIHPTMGETISSYKKLMNDPTTIEIWQTAFRKYFGGMAQGGNKRGRKGPMQFL